MKDVHLKTDNVFSFSTYTLVIVSFNLSYVVCVGLANENVGQFVNARMISLISFGTVGKITPVIIFF